MEGEQLPKATMNSFVRKITHAHFTQDVTIRLLSVSREFIIRLADRSNQICEEKNKKTISAEHLQTALEKFGISQHLNHLKRVGNNIKENNDLKREANKRLEENIERQRQQMRQKRLRQEPPKKMVTIRQHFKQIQTEDKTEDFDYEGLARNMQNLQGVAISE